MSKPRTTVSKPRTPKKQAAAPEKPTTTVLEFGKEIQHHCQCVVIARHAVGFRPARLVTSGRDAAKFRILAFRIGPASQPWPIPVDASALSTPEGMALQCSAAGPGEDIILEVENISNERGTFFASMSGTETA